MYRWTVAYIDEKKDQWEYEKIQREEDLEILQIVEETEEKKQKEDLEDQELTEKVEQHEKKSKKRKLEQELEQETTIEENLEDKKKNPTHPTPKNNTIQKMKIIGKCGDTTNTKYQK